MDAPQYPGYPSHYWYSQPHATGHYANAFSPGSDVQPQYDPQVMPSSYPNGHGVYSPAQSQYSTSGFHPSNPFFCAEPQRAAPGSYPNQGCPAEQGSGPSGQAHSQHQHHHFPGPHLAHRVILLDRTLTTVKVVMQCLQILLTPLASVSIPTPKLMYGLTLVRMHLHSNNGNQASSLHRTTMEILSVHRILQHGQALELALHHMGIEAHDSCDFDMSVNFQAAADFIHRALMLKQHLTLVEAICAVKDNRGVIPNRGFLRQLIKLDAQLFGTHH